MTNSLGLMNFLEQFTEFREAFYLIDNWFIIGKIIDIIVDIIQKHFFSPERTCRWPIGTGKDAQHC